MIICNSIWSILIQWIKGYYCQGTIWPSYIQKKAYFPFVKPYHTNKWKVQKEEIEVLRNCSLILVPQVLTLQHQTIQPINQYKPMWDISDKFESVTGHTRLWCRLLHLLLGLLGLLTEAARTLLTILGVVLGVVGSPCCRIRVLPLTWNRDEARLYTRGILEFYM